MAPLRSYMIDVDTPDVGGMGETKLRAALVKAMGQSNADAFFAAREGNIVTAGDIAKWAEAGFKVIDDFIAACKAQGIYVVLDLHAAPGSHNCEQMSDSPDGIARLWTQPDLYRQWTIDLWQAIAKRYANEPFVAGSSSARSFSSARMPGTSRSQHRPQIQRSPRRRRSSACWTPHPASRHRHCANLPTVRYRSNAEHWRRSRRSGHRAGPAASAAQSTLHDDFPSLRLAARLATPNGNFCLRLRI